MNTLKIILDKNASGKVAQLYKDFAMYVNSYQNKQVDVYVPKEMLYINAKELATNETPTNYANSVKIGGILTADDGSKKTTDSFYLDYLKETTINDVEYVVFERIMPKELTVYAGNQQIVVNVVSVDSGTTPPKVLQVVTTQICNLLIQNSDYIADETTVDPSKTEEIEAQLTTNTTDITNLKVRMTTAESNVEQNTEDIAKNTNDIDYLKQHISQAEEYIGQMTGTTLPTNQQLNDFVMGKVSREPKNADVVIFILQIPNATDKNYKYIYSVDGWNGYEIPPMEQASNGTFGIVEGTYNIGSTNNTIVDISGGQILNIYVKDTDGTFRNIREYINANATNLANIISGNTSVGIALKAVADEFGNNIFRTYLKQTDGVTKYFLYDYALPRVFNDIFYIRENGFSNLIPKEGYSFQKVTNRIGDHTLFDIEMRIKSSFELSKKNSANNTIYITADRDCVVTFRLKTLVEREPSIWATLDIELSTPISLQSLKLQKLEFTSIFTYLEDEVLKLKVDDISQGNVIRQILEVTTQEADQTTFTIYSNTTYPSTFNLNTTSQVVYHTNGKLGEEPVFELAPNGAITDSGVSLAGSTDAQLYNNVECQVVINIPIATQGYELFNENMSILGIELGGQTVRLATPYNFESGVATFKNLRQVIHSQDAVNGITYTMKCFIKISTGGNITFLVDEDNLTDLSKALFSSTTNEEVWVIPVRPTLNYDWNTTTLTMNFRSGSENYKQFKILLDHSDDLGLIYDSTRVYTRTVTQDFWLNESYRTIILQEPASGNIKTWLENIGAVKQGEAGTPNKNTGDVGIIKQKTGDNFYPKTFIDAVYDDNGNPLNTLMPVANPTLDGTEANLTALSVNGTKYKIPAGGGSGGDYIAGNGINITDNTISADTNVLATKEDIPTGETDITFNGTATATTEDLNNVVIGDTTYLVPSNTEVNAMKGTINNSLQLPTTAPTNTELVGIDANKAQVNIGIGSGLSLENGTLKVTSGGGGGTQSLFIHNINLSYRIEDIHIYFQVLSNIEVLDFTIPEEAFSFMSDAGAVVATGSVEHSDKSKILINSLSLKTSVLSVNGIKLDGTIINDYQLMSTINDVNITDTVIAVDEV